jgi:UDP-N-acetylglucosamine 3-dehydrogenase
VIRIGVIGSGEAARRHASAFEALAAACTVVRGGDAEELLDAVDGVDAVVVASAPELRFHHTALALESGLDVLVEQPVAETVSNARMLERIASLRPARPVVQVSQPDHFNPLLPELRRHAPVAIEMRRVVPGCADVVREAMVHDVHLLAGLAGSPLVRLQATGRGGPGHCVATLAFESGLIGTLTASAAGPEAASTIAVTSADARVEADLARGTLEVARAGVRESTQVPVGDPLVAQGASFLAAIRERGAPAVNLRGATSCLEVVDAVGDCVAMQAAATGGGSVVTR